jgi:hypothetical protein
MPLPRSNLGNESILKICASGMAKSPLEEGGLHAGNLTAALIVGQARQSGRLAVWEV